MANVTFTNYSINSNSVTLYFIHEGTFFDTDHEKTISLEEARSVISSMEENVTKWSSFTLEYAGHNISVKSSLAKQCIADFQAKHGN